MKKIVCICMIFVMLVFVFTGCGGKEDSKETSQPSVEQTENSKDGGNSNTEENTKVNIGQSNMSLPENFPKDVLPIMDDATIVSTMSNTDGFTIIYTTGKKYEETIKFYQNVMKDASELAESKEQNGYVLVGNKENHIVGITISKADAENVNVLLSVAMENNDLDTAASNYFEESEDVDLSENYPVDEFPILKGDKVTDSSGVESDSEVTSYLTVLSDKKMKEIMEYYELTWGKMENKYKQTDNESFTLQGEIGKYYIYINGSIQDDEAETVQYSISITEYKEE